MPSTHATAIVLEDVGVAIFGAPKSGKSTLAFHLIEHFVQNHRYGAWIADDRVIFSNQEGKLIAGCPENIKNLAHVREKGFLHIQTLKCAQIHVALCLGDDSQEGQKIPKTIVIADVKIPLLVAQNIEQAKHVLLQFMDVQKQGNEHKCNAQTLAQLQK